jgi:hypothetical protein
MYKIKKYSYDQAKKLNVIIKPSEHKNKKIDVFNKDGSYICSIGDSRYNDFPSYLEIDKDLALEKRRLYHIRHRKDNIIGTRGWYSLKILW